jgi:hypothetical protein
MTGRRAIAGSGMRSDGCGHGIHLRLVVGGYAMQHSRRGVLKRVWAQCGVLVQYHATRWFYSGYFLGVKGLRAVAKTVTTWNLGQGLH